MRLALLVIASAVIASGIAGEDGSFTVTTPGTVLNAYAPLAADAPAGTTTLTITSAGLLDSPAALGPLDAGDLVLILQMQGAVIDTSDGPAYGNVVALGGAGSWEIAEVTAVAGASIEVTSACGGLRNSYSASNRTQLVRVPRFLDLTVSSGASVVAPAWNGETGGVVALHVATTAVVDGTIDVTAAGFRGGAVEQNSAPAAQDVAIFRSALPAEGAEKGEGIAGDTGSYDALGGRFGRGAPANGGGGGDSHNAGGGGGANGPNGDAWTGQGIMDPAAIGAGAWALDPAYAANGNQLTRSSGGGRGGYTFSSVDADALTQAPGDAAWGGNQRRERGGWGGRPLDVAPSERVFFGGGGGAGDSNNGTGGAGGRGGGIVLLVADSVAGAGAIVANGAPGTPTVPTFNDGPGGGGAGGTILAGADVSVALVADGGSGGSQPITNAEAEGPGGGGGGGTIAISGGAPARSANGGAYGTSTSQSVTEFPANGATGGASGTSDATVDVPDLPICFASGGFGVEGSGCACDVATARRPSLLSLSALAMLGLAFLRRRR